MLLKDVMTRQIGQARPEMTLQEAAELMKSLDVGALPVCDGDQLIGMLTDRDIAIRAVADGRDPFRAKVGEAMTNQVIYCFDDEDVERAAKLMEDRQIRRLVVMDHDKHAVGIVSLGDIATRQSDDQLKGEVLEKVSMPNQFGGPTSASRSSASSAASRPHA